MLLWLWGALTTASTTWDPSPPTQIPVSFPRFTCFHRCPKTLACVFTSVTFGHVVSNSRLGVSVCSQTTLWLLVAARAWLLPSTKHSNSFSGFHGFSAASRTDYVKAHSCCTAILLCRVKNRASWHLSSWLWSFALDCNRKRCSNTNVYPETFPQRMGGMHAWWFRASKNRYPAAASSYMHRV